MTVKEIAEVIKKADRDARHYFIATDGSNYTVWMEYQATDLYADDGCAEEGWLFEVARFTRDEYDPVADKIRDVLLADDRIAVRAYTVEASLATGYIEHRFDCEG